MHITPPTTFTFSSGTNSLTGYVNLSPRYAEFAKRMSEIAAIGDPEWMHSQADDLMCELLRTLGYGEGVDIFEQIPRWYA